MELHVRFAARAPRGTALWNEFLKTAGGAIVATVMASPLFELVYGRKARETGELGALDGGLASRAT